MKLKFLITVFLIFIIPIHKVSSQVNEFMYISLSGGPSIPLGDFAKSDASKINSGYATIGGLAVLKFGLNFQVNYGLVSMIFANINGTDAEPYRNKIAHENPNYDWSIESENWIVGGALIGFRTRLLKEYITYHFEIFGGVLRSNSPEITATANTNQGTNFVKQVGKRAYTFTYALCGGFSYEISNAFSLTAEFNVLNANPRFHDVTTTTSIGGVTTTSVVSFNQTNNVYSILLGLKYSFM
jgi:hypothetical protein